MRNSIRLLQQRFGRQRTSLGGRLYVKRAAVGCIALAAAGGFAIAIAGTEFTGTSERVKSISLADSNYRLVKKLEDVVPYPERFRKFRSCVLIK
jgi:hypothetical protein